MDRVRELTHKQQRFVDEYLIDANATQAAIRAGYSKRTAYSIGQENLKKPEVALAIDAGRQARAERACVAADRVLLELARIAFFDVRKLFHSDGSPKRVDEVDGDTIAALTSIEIIDCRGAETGNARVLRFRMADKLSALDKCMRHLGLYHQASQTSKSEAQPRFGEEQRATHDQDVASLHQAFDRVLSG